VFAKLDFCALFGKNEIDITVSLSFPILMGFDRLQEDSYVSKGVSY